MSTGIFTRVEHNFVWTDKNIQTQEWSSVPSIWLDFSQGDWLCALSGLQRQGQQRIWCLLGTRVVMWVMHFNPLELRICYKVAKLAGSISKARAGQSACCLSSFIQWPMIPSSVCPLPKSRKWRKHSEETGSVMLIFYHFVIAWRVTWSGRICGNNPGMRFSAGIFNGSDLDGPSTPPWVWKIGFKKWGSVP